MLDSHCFDALNSASEMKTKTANRIVRGAVALFAFGLAAQQYFESGFSMATGFIVIVGVLFGWMAATGQG